MHDAKLDVLAFTQLSYVYRRKIWSNNPLERLSKGIKRRTNVVGIFPTTAISPVPPTVWRCESSSA